MPSYWYTHSHHISNDDVRLIYWTAMQTPHGCDASIGPEILKSLCLDLMVARDILTCALTKLEISYEPDNKFSRISNNQARFTPPERPSR